MGPSFPSLSSAAAPFPLRLRRAALGALGRDCLNYACQCVVLRPVYPLRSKLFHAPCNACYTLAATPNIITNIYSTSSTGYYLTPAEAYNLDKKLDDGVPSYGSFAGTGTNCGNLLGTEYKLELDTKECVFYINLKGNVFDN